MSEIIKMSLSDQGIKLEQIDVDINKLFSLSYTFDNLKLIMNTLLENQNIMSAKINELEKNLLNQKEQSKNQINSLEKKIKILSFKKEGQGKNKNVYDFSPNKITIEKEKILEKIIEKEKENKDIPPKKDEISTKNIVEENKEKEKNEEQSNKNIQKIKKDDEFILEPISGSRGGAEDFDEEENPDFLIDNEEIENLKQKIESLEQRFNTIEKNSKFNPSKLLDQGGSSEDIQLMKLNMKSFEDKFNELNNEKEIMKKEIEDIKIKVVDFNIYELFKDIKTTEGTIDTSKLLVMNLEEKFIKKTTIMDEKIKKNEEDMYNMKNEFQNVKNQADVINNSLNGFKATVKEISEQVTKTNDENSNMVNETNNKINEVYKKVLQKMEEDKKNTKKNFEKVKIQMKKLYEKAIDEPNKQNEGKGELSDSDLRCLAELTRRVSDLERQIKILYHGLDVSKTKEDLAKLENELMQKINEKDFFELSDKVNLQTTMSKNLREMVERVQDISNKNSKDLNFFLRKLESVTASMYAFKTALDALSGVKNENIFDPTRYLDVASFNDFIKSYQKDLEKVDKNIDDVRLLMADMSEVMKTKATGEDMKTFENLINNKLDELKLLCVRKFADKTDTTKNFKYVDAQIKHITQIVLKKNDKNESWLIAKKPIGGYSCASCEAYIGELKEKADFMAWNKYPNRDKEKNYRIGNGFSHMLNMLNVDLKNQDYTHKENNYESDDEIHRNGLGGNGNQVKRMSKTNMMSTGGLNGFNRSNILPKILGNKNEDVSNMTADNLERNNEQVMQGINFISNEDNNTSINYKQPHIVKVYRKNKYSAPDITRIDK